MKFLLSLLFIISFCKADSIYTNGRCVNYFDTNDGNSLYLEYSRGTNSTVTFKRANAEFLINNIGKFYYKDGECRPILEDDTTLFMMSLTGLICGTLLASVILHKVS